MCSLHTEKEWLTAMVNPEHVVSINRHRSQDLNMKSDVLPIQKRGGITGQAEIETYLALLCGNHRLVPMLASYSLNTRDLRRILIHLGGCIIS